MGTRFGKVLIWFVVLFGTWPASAEQLPVKTYTIADGLARDSVNNIRQDSHGFLWFCTVEGVSRFDGYSFTNYGMAEGLPHRVVDDLVESSDGDYLVGTDRGLVRFEPAARDANGSFFTLVPLGLDEIAVVSLAAGTDGSVWAGTSNGLYHLTKSDNIWQHERVLSDAIGSIFMDDEGSLWATIGIDGFVRRLTGRDYRAIRG